MISKIISLCKIWKLKRQLREIDRDIELFWITLNSRNSEFHKRLDMDLLYNKFVKLRDIEKKELNRQIKQLKK